MRTPLIATTLVLASLAAAPARAAAPAFVPVQGYLTDADGVPIDGEASVQLAVYDAAEGGTPLFFESHAAALEGGFFTVYLGAVKNLDLAMFAGASNLYLGITVDADPEMTPRIQVGSVPFAAYAEQCGAVDWSHVTGVPAGLADGDDDTVYTAGTGIDLNGSEIAVDPETIEVWARNACFDTETELTALLDDNYLPAGYVPSWSALIGVPGGFADGVDNDTTYGPGSGLALSGTTFSIANDGVTAAHIASDAVGSAEIASGAVGSDEIANGAVTAADLQDGAALAEIADDDGAGSGLDADKLDGYEAAALRTGADWAEGYQDGVLAAGNNVLRSVTVSAPAAGVVLVNTSGYFGFQSGGFDTVSCSITTGTATESMGSGNSFAGNDGNNNSGVMTMPFSGVRAFSVSGAGDFTVRLVCSPGLGTVYVYNSKLTALFVPARL